MRTAHTRPNASAQEFIAVIDSALDEHRVGRQKGRKSWPSSTQ